MQARTFSRLICVLAALMAAFAISPSRASLARDVQYEQDYGLGLARVSYQTGDALFSGPDSEEWAALSDNFTLRDGDRLWAGKGSKVETLFEGGGKAWLNYQSEMDIVALRHDPEGGEGDVYQLALVSGEGSFYVKDFYTPDSVFQVDGPAASVMAYGKAYFRMSVVEDGTTQIGVRSGSVEVESRDGSAVTLKKGEMLEVYPDGEVSRITPLPAKDGWDRWVSSRIKLYTRQYASSRYLPPDIREYSYEFDRGGRWVDFPRYGWVWVPSVSAGWSPYSNGRWVWIGGDFVWLPYDPWYAPFHYGRWSFAVSVGWFWVPPPPRAAFWSPGYVGWAWGPDFVYWVPLAPREIYYSLYQTRAVSVTKVYVNSRATNGVVAVKRNDFIMGRAARVSIQRNNNPFLVKGGGGARVMGFAPAKELKPVRETKVPKPGARVSGKALPPENLKEMRGFVRERGVARPGRPKAGTAPAVKPEKRLREAPAVKPEKRLREAPAVEPEKQLREAPPVKERGRWRQQPVEKEKGPVREKVQPAEKPSKGPDMEISPGNVGKPAETELSPGKEKKLKVSPEAAPPAPGEGAVTTEKPGQEKQKGKKEEKSKEKHKEDEE